MDTWSFIAGFGCGMVLCCLIVAYAIYSIKVYMKQTGLKWGDKPVKFDPYGKK